MASGLGHGDGGVRVALPGSILSLYVNICYLPSKLGSDVQTVMRRGSYTTECYRDIDVSVNYAPNIEPGDDYLAPFFTAISTSGSLPEFAL
jgi:hypothetical protein